MTKWRHITVIQSVGYIIKIGHMYSYKNGLLLIFFYKNTKSSNLGILEREEL